MNRFFVVVVCLVLWLESANSGESAICLPVGDKKLEKFPLDDTNLVSDLKVGSAIFPAGCVIDVWYGPELSGSATAEDLLKTRIIHNGVREVRDEIRLFV